MKKITQLLPLLMLFFTACQGQKEVIREVVTQVHTYKGETPGFPEAPANSSVKKGGVDDGGGGNGLEGKPLESYAFNLETLPEFQEHIVPVLKYLQTAAPRLATDMIYVSTERTWYLVPVKLQTISSAFLGTYFPTEQMAIQSGHDIWIDKNLYDKMDTQARVKLILHELLMGVRILEQLSDLEKCFAQLSLVKDSSAYKAARMKCFRTYPRITEASSAGVRISKDDYALIRKITNSLFSEKKLENIAIEEELTALGFRRY